MTAEKVGPIVITFGGGLSTRRRPSDIDINECTSGENFDLDPQVLALQKRSAFDLVNTAPNVGEIRGFAQNIRQDGTVTTLIQAGGNVYSWDHAGTFVLEGSTPSGSRLRGPREHNFTLDQYTIITDLEQQDVVKKWDGFTFTTLPHNLTGTFQAKYCRVDNERAFYGNVKNASTDIPHMLVVSERGDAAGLTVNDRPASTANLTDPIFILTPNLKPINGLTEAFGIGVISTKRGRLYEFIGSSAFDFDMTPLYDGSAVSGDEALVNIGNDVALGLPSRIESLYSTEKFGDISSDDLSLPIGNLIQNTAAWSLAYDRKRKILYCFPDNQSAVFVYNKRIVDAGLMGADGKPLSPWAKWTTGLNVNLQPTCVMPLIHPSTFEEVVYFGDANGKIFQFYGSGGKDGGTEVFSATRTSKLFMGLPFGAVFDVEGSIMYRKQFAATVTITFNFAGDNVFDRALVVTLPPGDGIAVYNGDGTRAAYYNASAFYGRSFSERITRQKFGPPGLEGWFQVTVDVQSEGDVDIQALVITFKTAE